MTFFEKVKQNDENYLAGMIAELMIRNTAYMLDVPEKKLIKAKMRAHEEIVKLLKTEAPEDDE